MLVAGGGTNPICLPPTFAPFLLTLELRGPVLILERRRPVDSVWQSLYQTPVLRPAPSNGKKPPASALQSIDQPSDRNPQSCVAVVQSNRPARRTYVLSYCLTCIVRENSLQSFGFCGGRRPNEVDAVSGCLFDGVNDQSGPRRRSRPGPA